MIKGRLTVRFSSPMMRYRSSASSKIIVTEPNVGVSTRVMNPGDACSITLPINASLAGPIFHCVCQIAENAIDRNRLMK